MQNKLNGCAKSAAKCWGIFFLSLLNSALEAYLVIPTNKKKSATETVSAPLLYTVLPPLSKWKLSGDSRRSKAVVREVARAFPFFTGGCRPFLVPVEAWKG